MKLDRLLQQRRSAWNEAATRSAMNYIDTRRNDWDLASFIDSGEEMIAQRVDPWLLRCGLTAKTLTAMDIGCGLGRLSRALSMRFRQVIAVDISDNMVNGAAEINADRRNLQFVVTSGQELPVTDTCVDFCFSALTFQHIPSARLIERYMAEIARVLVTGGYFLIQLAGPVRPAILNIVQNFAVSTDVWKYWAALKYGRHDRIATDAFSGVSISERRLAGICRRYNLALMEVARDAPFDPTYWAYGRARACGARSLPDLPAQAEIRG